MSFAARLNRGITQLAVGRHLPYRTVRVRLTLLYGGLFLLSGAALMAIAYVLLVNAGFVFTLQNPTSTGSVAAGPLGSAPTDTPPAFPRLGTATHPSAQTMAHWRSVAQCMRQHGVSGFPDPTTSVPATSGATVLSNRDGAIFAMPAAIEQSTAFKQSATGCGFMDAQYGQLVAQDNRRRAQTLQQLLIRSGLALGGMSLLSLGLGWLMAGRVLQPLEDSYQAQRQFVANASHELRAPLTRQRALIEVALASPEANYASLRKAHERVLASEQDLEQLIDALLGLARARAGVERREPFDCAGSATGALQAQRPEIERLNLDVHATLDPAPTTGDPRLLERLIANLVDNAVRHNTPGGYVEITTGTRDRSAFVSIANAGPTVPPEQLSRLFEPFQRLGAARTPHNSGHGLGLPIVQAIANAHRAELSVRARPEGGLAIDVSFPAPAGAGSRVTLSTVWTKRSSPRTVSETDAPARG